MTIRQELLLLWIAISVVAAAIVSMSWPAAHLGVELVPVGNDSFYHARRIIDTAHDPSSFYQFDPKIHAPEGSLLTWPWGYDYALGQVVGLALRLDLTSNPMALLIWIPVAAVIASVGLMILIARRLTLPTPMVALAGLCVALSPLTQFLHGVGSIDHHFAEYIFVLLALAFGLQWFRKPESTRFAVTFGVMLGIAPAVHSSLFVLQVPIVGAIFLSWLSGLPLPIRGALRFGVALCASTLAILLPSLPFQLGLFEFYTLSWFHLYVATATAIVAVLLARQLSMRNLLVVIVVGTVLILPLIGPLTASRSFIAGSSTRLGEIFEMRSLLRQIGELHGLRNVSNLYSAFVLLLPITVIYCVYRSWRDRAQRELLFFWIFSVFGLCLLVAQFRLHYFGSFALYLPWLLFAADLDRRWPAKHKITILVTSLCVVLLYYYPLRHQLWAPWTPAGDKSFAILRPMLDALSRACERKPGIVLADSDAGHYIRYYTDCSVIADNFLLTPQHGQKIEEVERLMGLRADELVRDPMPLTYVLVRPLSILAGRPGELKYFYHGGQSNGLAVDLLLRPLSAVPAEYSLMSAINLPHLHNAPYARLYRIERPRATDSTRAAGSTP